MRTVPTLIACVLVVGVVSAYQATGPRQSYGKWNYNEKKKYHYREYNYKPTPTDMTYKKQYIIYYKEDPKKKNWVYMYNPTTEKFWCRFPTANHPVYGEQVKEGKELWSIIPKDKQHKDLDYIPDTSYGKVGATCPTIPESTDKAPIQVVPPDLP